jgi:hypothetical protein
VKNPQGTGAKTTSSRFGYAVFFMAVGPLILALDCVVDVYWFIRHMYKMDLDKVAQKKKDDDGGSVKAIDRKTFKKMLVYFENQNSSDQQQISPQKNVAHDIREYLNVDQGIQYLLWKQRPGDPDLAEDLGESSNADSPPKKSEKGKGKDKEKKELKIPTIVKEYIIVKKMLINNALPIAAGKLDIGNQSIYSHKLIIDKKILYNMMLDLQRFRKLLLLKKSFFIFQQSYDGKPQEHSAWHRKVEERITQTFTLMNMRRVINIIGYDPS